MPRALLICPFGILPPVHGGAQRALNLSLAYEDYFHDFLVMAPMNAEMAQDRPISQPWSWLPIPPSNLFVRKFIQPILHFLGLRFTKVNSRIALHLILYARKYDVLILETLSTIELALIYRLFNPRGCVIFDALNDETVLSEKRLDDGLITMEEHQKVIFLESNLHLYAHVVLTCSEKDKVQLVRRNVINESYFWVIPNGAHPVIGLDVPRQISEQVNCKPRLLFVGDCRTQPNREAVNYLLDEVLPGLDIPVELDIVGRWNEGEMPEMANEAVHFHGFVEDLGASYAKADLVVVPLLTGSGTKLKVLEAMAHGKAILSTPTGVEGIELESDEEVALATTTAEFQEKASALLADPTVRQAMGIRALARFRSRYAWESIRQDLILRLKKEFP